VALETKYLTDLIKNVHRESHYTASVPSSLLQIWGRILRREPWTEVREPNLIQDYSW